MYDKLIYTTNLTVHCFLSPRLRTRPPPLPPQHEFPLILCNNHLRLNEMNGSFRPPPDNGEMNEMTLPSRHRILNLSPGGLRSSTIPLGRGGSPQYLRLMTLRSLGSKFHHLRTFCNLPAKVGALLSCFWSVTLTEREPSTFGDERDDDGDPGWYS